MGLTILAHASLPLKYWDHAFLTSVYLINRLPTSSLDFKVPYFELHHTFPDYQFLRTFGCACFPLLRPYNKHKFSFRSQECVFLGYSPSHKGYKCLSPDGKIYVSKDVLFNELRFPFPDLFPSPSPSLSPTPSYSSSIFPLPSPIHFPCSSAQHTDVSFSGQDNSSASHASIDTSSTASSSSSSHSSFVSHSEAPASSGSFPSNLQGHSSSPNTSSPIESSPNSYTPSSTSSHHHITSSVSTSGSSPTHFSSSQSSPSVSPTTPISSSSVSPPSSGSEYQPTAPIGAPSPTHAIITRSKGLVPSLFTAHMEPSSVKQALTEPKWAHAMQQEYDALLANGTWTLMPLPASRKPIGCKWVFRIKENPDGSIKVQS